MGIEKAKVILDEGLQRCQVYPWKDWDASKVEELIVGTKTALNELEEGMLEVELEPEVAERLKEYAGEHSWSLSEAISCILVDLLW